MADNVNVTPSGTTPVATDDVGGVQFQRTKLVWGVDGVATDASATNPLPIVQTDAELGNTVGMTSLRDLLVAQRYTTWADSIADGIAAQWTQSVANGGTITSVAGEGLVQTSANAAGSAQIVGKTIEYLPGQVSWFNSAISLGDTGSAGNIRRWGAFTVSGTTPQNGFYYELDALVLYAVSATGGVATRVASTSWSKFSTAPFTLDTNYHGFEIRFTANSAFFYIDNVLRHVVSGTTTPLTATLNFPITVVSVNTSGATNRVIAVRNVGLGRFGQSDRVGVRGALITPQSTAFAAAATGNTTGYDVSEAGNVSFIFKNTVAASAFATGGVAVFEQSDDNVSWGLLQVVRNTTGEALSTHTLGANAASTEMVFDAPVEGVNYVRVRLTSAVTTNGVTIVVQGGGLSFVPAVSIGQTITKGTQGATGITTQDLKDAGRNITNLFMAAPIITTTAEVMQSLTGYKSGAAVVATATPAVVTTGKTYRITQITIAYFNVAALGSARFTIRANTAGVAVIGSPLVWSNQVGISGDGASTAGHVTNVTYSFPDGIEFAAGTGIAVGMQGFGVVPTTGTIVGYGKIEILGYEY